MNDGFFSDDTLRLHIEGQLEASQARRLDAALEANAELRERYATQTRLIEALRRGPPQIEAMDFVARLRERRAEPAHAKRRWPAVLGVAATMAAAGWLVMRAQPDDAETFRAKAGDEATSTERWFGIRIYEVDAQGRRSLVDGAMERDDALAFTYANLGPKPFAYLMIFGVDAQGACHWYHPAYTDAATNPSAIPIEAGRADVPLPDRIEHDLTPGPYLIHALFMREPRNVRDVESRCAGAAEGADAFQDWSDVSDHVVRLGVGL